MATKNTALRNVLADAFGALFNTGSVLEIGTAGMAAVLVTFQFAADGFPAASNGVVTGAFVATTVAATAGGTAAEARVKSSGDTHQLTGLTVGTSGTNVIIDNTSIANGQNVTLNSFTWTEPAGTA